MGALQTWQEGRRLRELTDPARDTATIDRWVQTGLHQAHEYERTLMDYNLDLSFSALLEILTFTGTAPSNPNVNHQACAELSFLCYIERVSPDIFLIVHGDHYNHPGRDHEWHQVALAARAERLRPITAQADAALQAVRTMCKLRCLPS